MLYCECETPLIDVEHDAGCRRCGREVDFSGPAELDEYVEPIVTVRTACGHGFVAADDYDAHPLCPSCERAELDEDREVLRRARARGIAL